MARTRGVISMPIVHVSVGVELSDLASFLAFFGRLGFAILVLYVRFI
jgi:hypothetical protein